MNYFVGERITDESLAKTAWSKARSDVEQICLMHDWQEITVIPPAGNRVNADLKTKLTMHFSMGKIWESKLSTLKSGDVLLLQVPVVNNCFYLASILRNVQNRGVTVIALIHDLELLRMSSDKSIGLRSRARMWVEEKSVLGVCGKIIVHNSRMREFLQNKGIPSEKMACLELFDYLIDEETADSLPDRCGTGEKNVLIVAGNLHPDKAGYVYQMPETAKVRLYGVFYRQGDQKNLCYEGSFLPQELPAKLQGGFGLVWDGTSAQTCSGIYGEYLRYNNPHKTSLYLASEIPVVIWKEAALSEFVVANGVGIAVGSLGEAVERITAMPPEQYLMMCQNAKAVGEKLRRGGFLSAVLEDLTGR